MFIVKSVMIARWWLKPSFFEVYRVHFVFIVYKPYVNKIQSSFVYNASQLLNFFPKKTHLFQFASPSIQRNFCFCLILIGAKYFSKLTMTQTHTEKYN